MVQKLSEYAAGGAGGGWRARGVLRVVGEVFPILLLVFATLVHSSLSGARKTEEARTAQMGDSFFDILILDDLLFLYIYFSKISNLCSSAISEIAQTKGQGVKVYYCRST